MTKPQIWDILSDIEMANDEDVTLRVALECVDDQDFDDDYCCCPDSFYESLEEELKCHDDYEGDMFNLRWTDAATIIARVFTDVT